MLIISHRGNLEGPDSVIENHPNQIDLCISKYSMQVEIDLRIINGNYWLGHDEPIHKIDLDWLKLRSNFLWIHCKDIETLCTLRNDPDPQKLHYFWHQEDDYTITSKGYIWAYPGKEMPIQTYSIAVMPEIHCNDYSNYYGICTDYPEQFKV
jgi:hypothetical protein